MALNTPGIGASSRALGQALARPMRNNQMKKFGRLGVPRGRNNALTMAVRGSNRQMRPFGR
jgi:hypothetical protein